MKNSSQRLSFSVRNFFWMCSGKRRIKSKDTTATMKCAFSMIELIFVIVLMGILASVGGNFLPDNRLLMRTNSVILQIKEKQKDAIGNDMSKFAMPWATDNNATCITMNAETLHVEPDITLCFDVYGRPYVPIQEHLLLEVLDINVTHNKEYRTLSVLPMSGYVIMKN